MYQKEKNQLQQLDLPYSIQTEKNNSLIKFRGPCGYSSLLRKKIDKKGSFLLNIKKKIFYYRTINFIEAKNLTKIFPNKTKIPNYIQHPSFLTSNSLQYTTSNDQYLEVWNKKINEFFLLKKLEKKGSLRSLEIKKNNSLVLNKSSKKIKILDFPVSKNLLSEDTGLFDLDTFKGAEEKNGIPFQKRLFFYSFKNLLFNKKLLINKAFGVAFGYSIFLQLIGLGYRFSVQSAKMRVSNTKTPGIRQLEAFSSSYVQPLYQDKTAFFSYNFLNTKIKDSPKKNIRSNSVYVDGDTLTIAAGYSHKIRYAFPLDIRVYQLKLPRNKICLFGIDKDDVLNCASQIKQIHPPSTYKGKGIRINNEITKVRPGKKNK